MSRKTTYYCDRCGKEMRHGLWKFKKVVEFNFPFNLEWRTSKKELCDQCSKNLNKFMQGEKLVCERFDEILMEFNRDPDEQGNEGEMSENTQ